jgi:hypothetical protein
MRIVNLLHEWAKCCRLEPVDIAGLGYPSGMGHTVPTDPTRAPRRRPEGESDSRYLGTLSASIGGGVTAGGTASKPSKAPRRNMSSTIEILDRLINHDLEPSQRHLVELCYVYGPVTEQEQAGELGISVRTLRARLDRVHWMLDGWLFGQSAQHQLAESAATLEELEADMPKISTKRRAQGGR